MPAKSLGNAERLLKHWPGSSDWTELVFEYFESESGKSLVDFVTSQQSLKQIFPAAVDVFKAFECCSFAQTRVVILGQDPYHGPDQAHGLCFSVPCNTKPPPSLLSLIHI